jgi:hypothetical protein
VLHRKQIDNDVEAMFAAVEPVDCGDVGEHLKSCRSGRFAKGAQLLSGQANDVLTE